MANSLPTHGLARQAPLSMGFSREVYWSGLPRSFPGDLSNPESNPRLPVAPAVQADSLPLSHQGSPGKTKNEELNKIQINTKFQNFCSY